MARQLNPRTKSYFKYQSDMKQYQHEMALAYTQTHVPREDSWTYHAIKQGRLEREIKRAESAKARSK